MPFLDESTGSPIILVVPSSQRPASKSSMDPHSRATKPTSELMLSVMKSYNFCVRLVQYYFRDHLEFRIYLLVLANVSKRAESFHSRTRPVWPSRRWGRSRCRRPVAMGKRECLKGIGLMKMMNHAVSSLVIHKRLWSFNYT